MSIFYFAWAMSDQETKLSARLALFVLGDMAQDHTFPQSEIDDDAPVWVGICWPSAGTIAKKARIGRSQTFEALRKLEQIGLIRTIPAEIHQLEVMGRPVKTPVRQLAGPGGFKKLPCEDELPVRNPDGSGNSDAPPSGIPDPNLNKEQEEGEANASPSNAEDFSSKYEDPKTPGSAAAPWMVLELARLMHGNDDKCKLPVGVRELMHPSYLGFMTTYGLDKRRELLLPNFERATLRKWLDDMRLLVDTDQRDAKEVAQVLRWCQASSFWKTNILSPAKFRKQYAVLRGQWLEGRETGSGPADRRVDDTRAQMDALAKRQQEEQE